MNIGKTSGTQAGAGSCSGYRKTEDCWNGRIFNPPPGQGKTHNRGSTAGRYWQHPAIPYDPDTEVFIVEGIVDALSLIEMGYQSIAVLSAGQNPAKLNLSGFRKIVPAFDRDSAGRKALKQWFNFFKNKEGTEVSAICPVSGDWNDFLVNYGSKAAQAFAEKRPEFEFQARLALARNAREYADVWFKHRKYGPGLFEYEGRYHFSAVRTRKAGGEKERYVETIRVSDFTLTVDHFQLDTTTPEKPEFRYFLKVRPKQGRECAFWVSAKDISSPANLTTMFLQRAKSLWEGGREPSLALLGRITAAKAPTVRQLQIMGYDRESGCYVFRDFLLDRTGKTIRPNPRGFFEMSFRKFIRPAPYSTVCPDLKFRGHRRIYDLIRKAWGNQGITGLAWVVASWFVSQIKAETGFFPFLSFYGDTQTGKTRLTRILNGLQGLDEEGLPMRKVNTGKGEIRKLAQRSGLFQALLEGNREDNVRQLMDNILTLYNIAASLQLRARMSDDVQTIEILFLSAILFVQNREQFREKAQKERVISVEFRAEYLNEETTEAFGELVQIPVSGLAGFFPYVMAHRTAIEKEWPGAFRQAREELIGVIGDARISENHALVLAFHRILCRILGTDHDLRPYIEQIARRKHAECNRRDADLADYFFELVFESYDEYDEAQQSQNGRSKDLNDLPKCVDWRRDEGKLWVCLPLFDTLANRSGRPLRVQIKDLQQALADHPAYVGSNKSHRFVSDTGRKDKFRKAYLFDMSKLEE